MKKILNFFPISLILKSKKGIEYSNQEAQTCFNIDSLPPSAELNEKNGIKIYDTERPFEEHKSMNIFLENSQISLYQILTSLTSNDLQNNHAKLVYKEGDTKHYYSVSIHSNFSYNSKICEAILIQDISSDILIKENQFVEKAREIKLYLASVSHDLRTPINGIKGMLDNIIQSTSNSFIHDCVKSAQRSSDMLLLLIKDILDFSQIESNSLRLNIDNVNILDAINDIYSLFEKDFDFKHLNFIFKYDRLCNYTIPTDLIRYKQIISNLISNALKYTLKGSITLSIVLNQEKNELETIVEDTGVGIKEEKLSHLFKLFTKIEDNSNLNKEGVGLGLNICKKLVDRLGGKITVSSQYGKGTKFVVTISFLHYLTNRGLKENPNYSSSKTIEEINFKECTFILDIIMNYSHCECAKLLFVDDSITNLQVLAGYIRNLKINCEIVL